MSMCPDVSFTEPDITVNCIYTWVTNSCASDNERDTTEMTVGWSQEILHSLAFFVIYFTDHDISRCVQDYFHPSLDLQLAEEY